MKIIDVHIHCGNTPRKTGKAYTEEDMRRDLDEAGAHGAVIFAFPEDMYRIIDDPRWRNRTNRYILEVAERQEDVYPFYFVWNDYLLPDNLNEYAGIKWHRHGNEPRYDYSDPRCEEFLQEVRRLDLPVLIEEEYEDTVQFVERNPGLKIIIPHIGKLNGGPEKMTIFFDNPNILFDTSTANAELIKWALDAVGPERLLFGTDSSGCTPPFTNFPKVALATHAKVDMDDRARELIYGLNVEKLLEKWKNRG